MHKEACVCSQDIGDSTRPSVVFVGAIMQDAAEALLVSKPVQIMVAGGASVPGGEPVRSLFAPMDTVFDRTTTGWQALRECTR